MRSFYIFVLLIFQWSVGSSQNFIFNYDGPDTLYVDESCLVALDWGHPDQPTVSSAIGAEIDSFYIFNITNDYELNEMVGAGQVIEVTYKAVDDQGNFDYFSFQIAIVDDSPPVITQQASDQTQSCDDADIMQMLEDWYTNFAGLQATDNCEVNIEADKTLNETIIAFNQSVNDQCGNTKTVTVYFTISDNAGNQLPEVSATFNTIDEQDPVFTILPTALDTFCVGDIDAILESWIDSVGGAKAEDNCSDDIIWKFLWNDNANNSGYEEVGNKPYELQVNTDICDYSVNINFIAIDLCGNQKATFTTISIIDNNYPVFSETPVDTIVDCHQIPTAPPITAFDECKGDLIVLFEENSSQDSNPSSTGHYNYSIVQTWSAEDGCGHDIIHERIITVQDTTAPEFDGPGDITIRCDQIEDLAIIGMPINILDNCSAEFTTYYQDLKNGDGCQYSITRSWFVEDVSGNSTMYEQIISVVDIDVPVVTKEPEDYITTCDSDEPLDMAFENWISNKANAVVEDQCNTDYWFAAVPGSYNLADPGTFPGQLPTTAFLDYCVDDDSQNMFGTQVDFVFYDSCYNIAVFTKQFIVTDEQMPVLEECPGDTSIVLAVDQCAENFTIVAVGASDNCTGIPRYYDIVQRFQINSSIPGDLNLPVDTMTMDIGPFDQSGLSVEEILDLTLEFKAIDADDINEFFVIRGEDGSLLGTTPKIAEQCGDFVVELKDIVSPGQAGSWLADGYLSLTLEPNIVPEGGVFSINDICEESSVLVSFSYLQEPVSELYYDLSINQGPFFTMSASSNLDTLLPFGNYELVYRVADCAGNTVSCVQNVEIKDNQPPEIICPQDIQLNLEPDSCTVRLDLPIDFTIMDNCSGQFAVSRISPETVDESFLTFNYNTDLEQYVANNKNFLFQNIPQDIYARNPVLIVQLKGDIDEADEYFELLDENGQLLGSTLAGSCDSFTVMTYAIDENLFNTWKSDGEIALTARSVVGTNAINPCDTSSVTFDGGSDGQSAMYVTLSYEALKLAYYVTGATKIPSRLFSENELPPQHDFLGGTSNVHYVIEDYAGNRDTCSFEVKITDSQAPVAICKEAIPIFIDPSGLHSYILSPEELNDGSFDNCAIDSMAVSPNIFTCAMTGTTVEVMLYVWDAVGNADSCQASVKVETEALHPSYQAGVCAFDTLRLFANLTEAPDGIYTILWTKQNNGFSSNEENPVRPNADASYSGTYSLEVSGLNGCSSTGFVDVFIEDLSTPVLNVDRDTVCEGDLVYIETATYSGNVVYYWYLGLAPNGVLVDSTLGSSVSLQPDVGESLYYVVVESENCISVPSSSVHIQVLEKPKAIVNDPFINICEGEELVLGTEVTGADFTYYWWGPDSFTSFFQNPGIIENAQSKHQGTYRLAIFNSFCSDTAIVEVLVNERPLTPEITSDSIYCEGETIILSVANITNADNYTWFLNDLLYTVQNTNTLVIPGAQSQFSGDWKVVVKDGLCYSDTSSVHPLQVEVKFEISASNTGPVCEGDSIMLIAPELPGAAYLWQSPGNDSLFTNNPIVLAKEGLYRLLVTTSAGCELNASTFVEVHAIPEITALSNNAPECIDGTECIEFVPSVYPNASNYIYDWFGPNGFTSADSIAMLCNVDTSMNGRYELAISNGYCISDTVSTYITMASIPLKPILNADETICENDTIILHVGNYYGEELDYYWSTPNGNLYQTQEPVLKIPHAVQNLGGKYAVQTYNGSCFSQVSDSIYIEVLEKPNQPVIWSEESFCEGEEITLFTNYVPDGVYYWEGPNAFYSSNQNPIIFPSDTLAEGIYRLYVSVNGCESVISEALVIRINRKPDKPVIIDEVDAECISETGARIKLCLSDQDPLTVYNWYHNPSGILLKSSSGICIDIDDFEGFEDGLNGIFVVAEKDGCFSYESDLIQIQTDMAPDRKADAGVDFESCNDQQLYLDAIPDDDGRWGVINDGILVYEAENASSRVLHLTEGKNLFIWSLSHGICLDYDTDTMELFITYTPEASDDYFLTDYKQKLSFDPVLNDLFSDNCVVLIADLMLEEGELIDLGNNAFEFIPDPGFIGELIIPYTIYNVDCPEKSDQAKIVINVGEADNCFGVNIITPNGDGVNDNLVFPCLETPLYPLNKLTVFNQWGDEVYNTSPYNNDWYGTYRNKDLPVGTYYYILDLRNGSTPTKGFFVIER